MKRRTLAAGLGLLVTIAIFGIAEAVLAYLQPAPAPGYSQSDPLTRWSLRPGFQGTGPDLPDIGLSYEIRVNGDGFRGAPIDKQKSAGVFRIATLGDSVTFGFGVAEEDTLAALIASLLTPDVAPRKVEWINAGVPGFSSFQGARHLERRLLPMSPDLVTVLYGWNDGWRSVAPDTTEPAEPAAPAGLEAILRSSRVVTFSQRTFNTVVRRVGLQPPPRSRVRVPRVSPEEFEANLLKMAALIREAGGVPVFLTAPAAFGPRRPPDSYFRFGWMVPREELDATRARYAEATRRAAATASVLLVDCARLVPSDPELFLGDGYHPKLSGFQLMARQVVDAIRQAHLIQQKSLAFQTSALWH